MFFTIPARTRRHRLRLRASTFSLEVFLVADQATQQRVLFALRRFRRHGVRALGTDRAAETFVVVDCKNAADSARVRRVVLALDPHAMTTFSSGSHEHLGIAS
jgi:hypothetical protein